MERAVYDRMAELDELHWWYRARHDVLQSLIERTVQPRPNAKIIEIGCGTGHNFAMLSRFGKIDALEIDPAARSIAEKRLGRRVSTAELPDLTAIPRRHYDLIAALDVVEHVTDDRAAIMALASCLKPGGKLLLTVPAHQWMWSAHDELNHHKRRYSKRGLVRLFDESSLQLQSIGYFNSLLFPLAVAARMTAKLIGGGREDDKLPPKPVNALFNRIFAAERHLVGRVPLPVGLSLFAVAAADHD
jgi:SAM-dependent methyltransferase